MLVDKKRERERVRKKVGNWHDKVCVVFVDAVITQMDARIIQTALVGRVLDGGESHDAVTIQIDDEWIIRRDSNVKTQIALKWQKSKT